MQWYEKAGLYMILGFAMVKFGEVIGHIKDEIDEEEDANDEIQLLI